MQRRAVLAVIAGTCSVAGCIGSEPSAGVESASAAEEDEKMGDSSVTGSIDVVVDGDPLDHPRDEWSAADRERLTVAEAVDALPGHGYRRNDWRALTVGETSYDETDVATELAFFVDDSLVDPDAYELEDGDSIVVEITTDGAVSYEEDSSFIDASGEIDVLVDGEPFDLTRDRFQAEHAEDHAMAFHLHEISERWYVEDWERVTLGGGLDLLPHVSYARTEGRHVLAIDETAYDERTAGTELAFFVDGELVNPAAYDLEDGEEVLVEITTGS
ncbi:hypothetical protein [Natronococcus wangiae]|uniref:hypothetical protein n=1 Tax=Natronococcus wangiae TaxID=3068275 RepID=UPI00273D608E|nr:hypothetical protein [Natronococcus sp. AD5]